MEKYYIVTCKEFLADVERYKRNSKERNDFFVDFSERHHIDGNEYYFGGDGSVNQPFEEYHKNNICLAISDTEHNSSLYRSQCKTKLFCNNLIEFKKSSPVLKEFQQECIDKNVIINLHRMREGDYFKELHYGGYSVSRFECDNNYYLKIETDRKEMITPEYDGFNEIKASEFYLALEKFEAMQ